MNLKKNLWRKLRRVLPVIGEAFASPSMRASLLEQEMRLLLEDLRNRTPGNPALQGFKVYSQVDEDGIIEAICQRLGIERGTLVEIGCGNGTENNTHYMLLKGWRGVWVDGSDANIAHIRRHVPSQATDLLVEQRFITRDNVQPLMKSWVQWLKGEPDVLSLDIDGNDAIVLDEILKVASPRVLVLEYNGKFPPPLKVSVSYDPEHSWAGDDYYGSSLQVFVDLLQGRYRLVSCGLSGANAYFVKEAESTAFPSNSVAALYMPARHHLIQKSPGAIASLKHLRARLGG